jgi:HK97 family phage portal protein
MIFGTRKLKAELESLKAEMAEIKNEGGIKLNDIDAMSELFGVTQTIAGPPVSAESAMRCSAVYACVRLIASCISSSPLLVYKRSMARAGAGGAPGKKAPGGEREVIEEARRHSLSSILRLRPNPFISASVFWKVVIQHKILSGNGYAIIMRKRPSGDPEYLIPVKPSRVQPYQAWELGLDRKLSVDPNRLYYWVTLDNGELIMLDQDDMLHFPNLGFDGRRGLSTISAAAQSVGLAFAAEEHGARFFSQGAEFNFALKYPGKLGNDALERMRDYWTRRHGGLANRFLPPILTDGGDIKEISMSARDAQLIESRQFSVVDICRFFGVPPVMIGETEKTSSWGSGVEQVGRWFVMFTLNDHFTDIEQELEAKLFRDGIHFAAFDESELTRGDTKTRAEAYRIARGSMQEPGYMTVNEIRLSENLPPDPAPESDKLQKPVEKTAQTGIKSDEKPLDQAL